MLTFLGHCKPWYAQEETSAFEKKIKLRDNLYNWPIPWAKIDLIKWYRKETINVFL